MDQLFSIAIPVSDEVVVLHSECMTTDSTLCHRIDTRTLLCQLTALALGVLALTGKFRHSLCIATNLAAEFLSLFSNTVAGWVSAFVLLIHQFSLCAMSTTCPPIATSS